MQLAQLQQPFGFARDLALGSPTMCREMEISFKTAPQPLEWSLGPQNAMAWIKSKADQLAQAGEKSNSIEVCVYKVFIIFFIPFSLLDSGVSPCFGSGGVRFQLQTFQQCLSKISSPLWCSTASSGSASASVRGSTVGFEVGRRCRDAKSSGAVAGPPAISGRAAKVWYQ